MGSGSPVPAAEGVEVVEVNRPNRRVRRIRASPTRSMRSRPPGPPSAVEPRSAKTKDGHVEAIRVLVVAKRSARQARVKAIIQMRHLGIPLRQLHSRLKGLTVTALVAEAALRSTRSTDPVTAATKASLSSLAHRVQSLDRELAELDDKIESLLLATAPDLLGLFGVGPDTAASLLVAAGDNPERLHSEAAWAHLCGVSPMPAGSGKKAGHLRRHDGGDRQANSALWRIAMVRIAHDPETTAYFERRVKEGGPSGTSSGSSSASRRRSIATSLAAESPGRGSGSPHNCRPSG